MSIRSLGVSEARRLLPEIVRRVSKEGGRVDVTHRGQSSVSIVRTSDLSPGRTRKPQAWPAALRVEVGGEAEDLVSAIRALRAAQGRPRPLPAARRRSRGRRA